MNIYTNLYENENYKLLKSETLTLYEDIEFIAFDYDLDDFDKFGLLAGNYELRTYLSPGGYKSYQIVVDDVEIDIPDEYYIERKKDIEENIYITLTKREMYF